MRQDQSSCNSGCAMFGIGNRRQSRSPKNKKDRKSKSQSKQSKSMFSKSKTPTDKSGINGKVSKFQRLIKKDQKQRLDDFDTKRNNKMLEKKMIKVMKMCQNEADRQALLDNQENCCNQCNLPYPLLCWRYKIRFNINKNRLDAPDLDKKPNLRRLRRFAIADIWR